MQGFGRVARRASASDVSAAFDDGEQAKYWKCRAEAHLVFALEVSANSTFMRTAVSRGSNAHNDPEVVAVKPPQREDERRRVRQQAERSLVLVPEPGQRCGIRRSVRGEREHRRRRIISMSSSAIPGFAVVPYARSQLDEVRIPVRPLWGLFSGEDKCLSRPAGCGKDPREEQNGVLTRAREGGLVGIIDKLVAEERLLVGPSVLLHAESACGVNEDDRLVDDDLRRIVIGEVPEATVDEPAKVGAQSGTFGVPEDQVLVEDMM